MRQLRWKMAVLAAAGLAVAAAASAGGLVVPVFTYAWPGADGNLWYTELVLTNPTGTTVTVNPPAFLPGAMVLTHPCLPPLRPVEVPPGATIVWRPFDVAMDLECPDRAVGALLLDADGPVAVRTRVTNVRDVGVPESGPLEGFGQDVPAVEIDSLPAGGTTLLLPGMIWHPNACGPPAFDSYVGFANPGDEPVTVSLAVSGGAAAGAVIVDGGAVDLPAKIDIPGHGWRQLHLVPAGAKPAVCLAPQRFDLAVTVGGPVAVYGSVVDRSTGDPRTVLPVALE